MTDKLYRCPACGEILIEEEYETQLKQGQCYCLCEFFAVDEKGEIWYPRIMNEYEVFEKVSKI